jgi:hypothetical protein
MGLKEEHLGVRQHHGWARDFDFGETWRILEHFERVTAGSIEQKHITNPTNWNVLMSQMRYCQPCLIAILAGTLVPSVVDVG